MVLLGCSLFEEEIDEENQYEQSEQRKEKIVNPLLELDAFLTQLSASVSVDLVPGESDPSNFSIPQQPMHRCLFPSASTYSTFNSITNPCEIKTTEGHAILVSGGQSSSDLLRVSESERYADNLEKLLRWRHLSPTAPDTLACYPFQNQDPFILSNTPHIFASGGSPEFDTKLLQGEDGQTSRLIAVPSFSETRTVALLNLNDLSCFPMKFRIPAMRRSHKMDQEP